MEIKSRIELPKLLKHLNLPLIGCEVGVAGGNSAIDFLKNGLEKIYLVDAWKTLDVFGDGSFPQDFHNNNFKLMFINLLEFDKSRYVILRGLSSEMHIHIPDKSLGLVYIDCNHEFQSVRDDIKNYRSKLVDGGVIAFHDYVNLKGVRVAVKEFARLNHLTIHDIPETSRGDAGAWMTI